MSTCSACGHAEKQHVALGCRHITQTVQTVANSDGSITQHRDASSCGCAYFRGRGGW